MLDKQPVQPAQLVPIKREKHVELDSAIKDICQLRDHANDLLLRIVGNPPPAPPAPPEEQPCSTFQEVLTEGPERIRNMCSETHKILEEINQTLF